MSSMMDLGGHLEIILAREWDLLAGALRGRWREP